jgi:basic amino acid/polyamine antiporter, APA family
MAPLTKELFRRRPVLEMTGADSNSSELVRSIGLFQLSMFGIGTTIGTGIVVPRSRAETLAHA